MTLLTIYRLAAAPVAAGVALAGHRDAFFVLLIVSLITDLIDGPLARRLGQVTELGAKLDTIADSCTVIAGIFGLYLLDRAVFRPELPALYVFLASYAAAALACLVKFRVLPAYHLYTSKLAAFWSGVFFIWLYAFGYSPAFFVSLLALGVLANVESLLSTWRLKRFQTDIGSLFRIRDN